MRQAGAAYNKMSEEARSALKAEAQAMQPTPIAQLPPEQKLAMAKHLRSEN